jgi:Mrp family chromosome partitioning ATPase
MQVFFRLSEEESRLSAMKTLPVTERLEKRRIISDKITIESDRLTSLQNSRATLSDALLQSWTNQVQITQLASRTSKVPSNFQLITIGAAIAGLAAAMAFVIGIGYLDNSAQYVRDLESEFDIPLLGRIQTTNSKNISQLLYVNQSAVKNLPHSVTADDYRLIVVKMLHRISSLDSAISENDNSIKFKRLPSKESIGSDTPQQHSILICGLNSMQTASEIAANLAVVLAQTGNTVLLVDLTLHDPENAKLIESDMVTGSSISLPHSDSAVELLTHRELKNLSILPISPSLLDSSGLFAPLQIPETISSLKKYANYILIVGSNLMSSTETFVLASRVDGLILVTPEIGLKPDQVDSLMKNALIYKWEIIGSVLVKIRTSLQPFRNQRWASSFEKYGKTMSTGPGKIRTSLVLVTKQMALWFEKHGMILGKNSAIPEKEGVSEEPNDNEGQSL